MPVDIVQREQLAAQVVAVMDAHWGRPTAEEKRCILRSAQQQIEAADVFKKASVEDQALL